MRARHLAPTLLLGWTAAVHAQAVATRTLGKPLAELEEPFSSVTSVRELGDGRVIVVDQRERAVRFADLARGTVEAIGREGSGPGEYRLPSVLLALPNDSTLLPDPPLRRMLVIAPDGHPAGTLVRDWAPAMPGAQLPRAADGVGHFYQPGNPVDVTPTGLVTLDTAPLLRIDRRTKHVDTVAYIRLPDTKITITGDPKKPATVSIVRPPFVTEDVWGVFPDGTIAIARAIGYRVDWVLPNGRRVAGPRIPYEPVPVTQREKDAWRARQRPTPAGRGAPAVQAAGPEPQWPDQEPPFLAGAALAAPDGKLWVRRTAPASETASLYDVVDRTGRVVERVRVSAGGRIVGFGAKSMYVVRVDDDDLEYLQRHAM